MCQADRQLSRRARGGDHGGGDHGGTLLTGLLSSLLCYFSLQSGSTNPGMPLPHRHTLGLDGGEALPGSPFPGVPGLVVEECSAGNFLSNESWPASRTVRLDMSALRLRFYAVNVDEF